MPIDNADPTRPGIVLFDDPMLVKSGWACFAGEQAWPISGTTDLPTTGVWVTNLGPREFHATNLATNRFRCANFLRSSLDTLANECGVSQPRSGATGQACAEHLAGLLGNVLNVAVRMGVNPFPPHTLATGFRHTHYRPQKARVPEEIAEVLAQAFEPSINSQRRDPSRSRYQKEKGLSLVRHRYKHISDLLGHTVPYGNWRTVPRMTGSEIENHERPLLLRVEIDRTDELLGQVLNFGGQVQHRHQAAAGPQISAAPRRWITHPEYVYLKSRADITVTAVLEAERYIDNPLQHVLPEFGFHQQLSPAFLLALEALWSCPFKNEQDRWDPTPMTHWMQAYDRIYCIDEALKLMGRDPDVDVLGVGNGRIRLKITDPGEMFGDRMWSLVRQTSLIPPTCTQSPASVQFDRANPIELYQAIQLAGSTARLLERDQAAIKAWDEQLAQSAASSQAA